MNWREEVNDSECLESSDGELVAWTFTNVTPFILYEIGQELEFDELNTTYYTWEQFKTRFGCDNSDKELLRQTIEHIVRMYGYQ